MIEQVPKIPLVKEIFPISHGLFSIIDYDFGDIANSEIDVLFVTDFGMKRVAPLVEYVLGEDTELSAEKLAILGDMLLKRYKNKWDRALAILNADYDPLHNYLDEYQEHKDEVKDESDVRTKNLITGDTANNTSSNTRTDNLSESRSGSDNSTTTESGANNRYGLNSSDPTGVTTDSNSVTVADTNSSSRTNTGTQSNSSSESLIRTIQESGTDRKDYDTDNNYDVEGYHRGNIGNISTQKLIKEDLELWKWNFIEEVLHDTRDFLTLPLYF